MRKKPGTRNHRYHLRNWKEYNSALKARGSLTLWMDESAISNWIKKPRPGEKRRPGAQTVYSDLAIKCLLTVKAVFHLPLRATEGFARSLIEIMRLSGKLSETLRTPHYSTLSRRAKKLHVGLGVHHNSKEPLHLVVDSTGLKLYGDGEWKVKKHGTLEHRRWRKMHLLLDSGTLLVREVATSGQYASDSKEFVKLLGEEADPVAYVKGDGAYDTHEAYDAMRERPEHPVAGPPLNIPHVCMTTSHVPAISTLGSLASIARPEHPVAIFPPHRERRRGTRPRPDRGHPRAEGQRVNPGGYRHHIWQHGNRKAPPLDRDRHVRRIREVGRKQWKDEVRFGERSLVETEVFRFEKTFGPSLSARTDATRETEVRIKVAALNRMTELGMPDSFPVQAA